MTRYQIMREWSEGFAVGIVPSGIEAIRSEHWQAGYSAGYATRKEKNRLMDEYLVSIGQEPQAVIRTTDITLDTTP